MSTIVLHILLLAFAVSADTFTVGLTYGMDKVRIPYSSAAIISGIPSLILLGFLYAGASISAMVPANITGTISFVILAGMAILKLFDSSVKALIRRSKSLLPHRRFAFTFRELGIILTIYANPEAANKDTPSVLTPAEALPLSLALSLDSAAVGVGAGVSMSHPLLTAAITFFTGCLGIYTGKKLSAYICSHVKLDFSFIGGLLLLLLAWSRL